MKYRSVYYDYDFVDFKEDAKDFSADYYWWDKSKTRGCVCDAQYADVDCSKRLCPYGTDVLADREDLLSESQYQIQAIVFSPENNGYDSVIGKTFALTFVSKLNETFTTIPIVFGDITDADERADMENDVRLALLRLPNQVIDDCSVSISFHNDADDADYVEMTVTFSGDAVRGPQNMLVVEDYECSAGCTPRISGLGLETAVSVQMSGYFEDRESTFNSYECGRRGKCDYKSGLCQCFEGYTGENCQILTTLV